MVTALTWDPNHSRWGLAVIEKLTVAHSGREILYLLCNPNISSCIPYKYSLPRTSFSNTPSLYSSCTVTNLHNKAIMAVPTLPLLHAFSPITYQCSRRQCRNADSPSIRTKMATVSAAHTANTIHRAIPPTQPSNIRPLRSTMFHNTSDNSATTGTSYNEHHASVINTPFSHLGGHRFNYWPGDLL